jgi:hypothetical protein
MCWWVCSIGVVVLHIAVCYCIEICAGGSVSLVLYCDILLFVTALVYVLVGL